MKKISILLPYYNDERFLEASINSVLSQSYEDFELILINHASTDDSERIAKSFLDKRIKHIKLDFNQGAGGGLILNAFLKVAKGKYFKSMCADDLMYPYCLELLSGYLDENPTCVAVFGDMEYIDEKGKEIGKKWYEDKGFNVNGSILEQYFNGNSVLPYPAGMARMKDLRSLKIDTVIFGMFDMSIWVQFLVKGKIIKCLSHSVCQYRIHEAQESSSTKIKKLIRISNYESQIFYHSFLKLPLESIRILLPNNKFVRIAEEIDKDFVITHHFSELGSFGSRFFAINYLHKLMQNDTKRKRIRDKFGYEIIDLRDNYSNLILNEDLSLIKTSKILKELRKRIKSIFSKKLTVS